MKKSLWTLGLILATSSFVSAEAPFELKKETRIVGGTKAPRGAWPSTVALLQTSKLNQGNYKAQFCGGTLISSKWILTAAHCVFDGSSAKRVSASSITVLLDTSDLSYGGVKYDVRRIVVHPSYSPVTEDADIALLELKYDTGIRTIAVTDVDVAIGKTAMVVGWGAMSKDESYFPDKLHEVDVPIVTRSVCESVYGDEFTQNMFCAGYESGGKDTCKADSGGPLMVIENGEYVQAGITSWGIGCAQQGYYGIYTRLSRYKGWIDAYKDTSSEGGSLFFLLLPLALIIPVRRKLKAVVK